MVELCPNCNTPLSADDAFCGKCGAPRTPGKIPAKIATQVLRATPGTPILSDVAPAEIPPAVNTDEQPTQPVKLPVPSPETATPVDQEVAAESSWVCDQCQSTNSGEAEYCDNCGVMRVASTREKVELVSPDDNKDLRFPEAPIKVLQGTGFQPGWRVRSAGSSNEGLSRRGKADEDSILTIELKRYLEAKPESFGFYLVADGLGGQEAGEVASKMAVQHLGSVVLAELAAPWMKGQALSADMVGEVIQRALRESHSIIRQFNADAATDSGTTAAIACVVDNLLISANAGDSRVYLWRANPDPEPIKSSETGATLSRTAKTVKLNRAEVKVAAEAENQAEPQHRIERVTRDQSLVQDLVDGGVIGLDEVYSDPRRHVILSALGSPEETTRIDVYRREMRSGDRVLICSDGLWEMLRDPVIAEQVATATDLQAAVDRLVELANQNGGLDNVSVVIVENVFI